MEIKFSPSCPVATEFPTESCEDQPASRCNLLGVTRNNDSLSIVEERIIEILRLFHCSNAASVGAENGGSFGDYLAHGSKRRRTGHSNGLSDEKICFVLTFR